MFSATLVLVATCALVGAYRPKLDGRIIGGKDANIEDIPYQLSLMHLGSHLCGASIINENWALTAAHCVQFSNPESVLTIRSGSSILETGGKVHDVDIAIAHPKFHPGVMVYDYALIKVRTPFDLNSSTSQVISLATKEAADGTIATVSGWGTTSESSPELPINLQRVDVPIVNRDVCNDAYGDISHTMICAGYKEGGKDSCEGDSGGPLVAGGVQVGIVSWGYGCAVPEYPGIYANVADPEGHKWIVDTAF